ncbi:hypothetical protein BCR33DRAFT_724462 [Rhizoclosmatium globosum]|uniref:Uncharacterized protein n=1 Tax=Rhizoclosmatium globosum TaxID=329046 RepID=A0A1Y2B6H5_9FUNG|nr:hypothetical protein BCR33DRAFT_724462 [Rhizoclosmatium globosum]|eukprot:ORY30140.1 hypothetical protein BCR33DRAFT_724462 [Rhizoclosmatium globosum]
MVNLLKQTFADWKVERLSQTRRVSPPPSKQAVSSRPVRNQTGQRGQSEGLEGRQQQPHFDNIKTPPKKEQLSLTSLNLANNHQNTSSSVLNPRRLYEKMDLDGYYPYQDHSEDYDDFCARRHHPPSQTQPYPPPRFLYQQTYLQNHSTQHRSQQYSGSYHYSQVGPAAPSVPHNTSNLHHSHTHVYPPPTHVQAGQPTHFTTPPVHPVHPTLPHVGHTFYYPPFPPNHQ